MSYYCKGGRCPRKKECERYIAWQKYPDKTVKQGYDTGVWFVPHKGCYTTNFCEGVFIKEGGGQ